MNDIFIINDILGEIINHLSPISMIIFSITNKNIHQLCQQNQYYQIFNQNRQQMDCGLYYTMIINNNRLYTMGVFNGGQLAKESEITYSPTSIATNVISVHSGDRHCIYLTSQNVYGMGSNLYGQLGLSILPDYKVTILPINVHDVLSIFCAADRTFILTKEGLYGLGYNGHGELGLPVALTSPFGPVGPEKYYDMPTKINFNEQVLQVCGGNYHTIVRTKHNYYGFGTNRSAQLGLPYNDLILRNVDTVKASCGSDHTILLSIDGAYGLGSNVSGQLGLGLINYAYKPTKILSNVIDLCCGTDHSLLLTIDALYVCGSSYYGELGLGDHKTQHKPVKLSIKLPIYFSCGYGHSIIRTQHDNNGEYYGIGSNRYSQLGLGKYKNKKYNRPQLLKFK